MNRLESWEVRGGCYGWQGGRGQHGQALIPGISVVGKFNSVDMLHQAEQEEDMCEDDDESSHGMAAVCNGSSSMLPWLCNSVTSYILYSYMYLVFSAPV